MKHILTIMLISHLLITAACNNTQNNNKTKTDSLTINLQINQKQISINNYTLPIPIETISYIKKYSYFNSKILNSIKNKDKYQKTIEKTLNLGVYTADLTYCTVLNQNQYALYYYSTCYSIAQDLELEVGFTKRKYENFTKNLDNSDTLIIMATDSYNEVCEYLDKQHRTNILPFFIIGGWYESMYLVIKTGEQSDMPPKETQKFILQQEKSVMNMINYLYDVQIETSAYRYNKELNIFINNLKKISTLYDNYRVSKDTNIYTIICDEIINLRELIIRNQVI